MVKQHSKTLDISVHGLNISVSVDCLKPVIVSDPFVSDDAISSCCVTRSGRVSHLPPCRDVLSVPMYLSLYNELIITPS